MEEATGFRAIALEGDKGDLDDWRDAFQPPGDPHFSDRPEGPILRWRQFDQAGSAEEVYQQAKVLMPQLNAVMAITRNALPVRLAGVVEIDADGTYHRSAFAEAQHFGTIRIRSRRVGMVASPTGEVITQPPQPSSQQQWIALAQAGDQVAVALREALNFLSRGDNWFDLYKAYECLRNEGLLKGVSKNEVERFTHTANHYHRHAKAVLGQGQPPPRPMTADEAASLLRQLVQSAFREEEQKRRAETQA